MQDQLRFDQPPLEIGRYKRRQHVKGGLLSHHSSSSLSLEERLTVTLTAIMSHTNITDRNLSEVGSQEAIQYLDEVTEYLVTVKAPYSLVQANVPSLIEMPSPA